MTMVIAAVDTGGHLAALSRMDNSQMGRLDNQDAQHGMAATGK